MRVFALAIFAAVLLAAGFWLVLAPAQESAAVAFSTGSARVTLPEANDIGREPNESGNASR